MIEFLERLPLRLGALAGLLVGTVSLIAGTDPWESLRRVGAAFLIFGALGFGLRALMQKSTSSPVTGQKPTTAVSEELEPGSHIDHKTPEMTVDDL